MTINRWLYLLAALTVASATSYVGCGVGAQRTQPVLVAKELASPPPGHILEMRKANEPSPLVEPGDVARFIDWAGRSTMDEHQQARRMIADASRHDDVVKALIDEVEAAQNADHGRALLVLAILGEMKSPLGTAFLMDFMRRRLPERGTVVSGEIIEQTAQAILAAKAVDGVAYLRTEIGDHAVLQVIAEHPSRIVRAEAINAYLWNHGDSRDARRQVLRYVRAEERILIDRVRRRSGEGAATFNARLKAFLDAHPEAVPPPPVQLPGTPPQNQNEEPVGCFDLSPPKF